MKTTCFVFKHSYSYLFIGVIKTNTGFSRIPVYRHRRGVIVGVLFTRDLLLVAMNLAKKTRVREVMRTGQWGCWCCCSHTLSISLSLSLSLSLSSIHIYFIKHYPPFSFEFFTIDRMIVSLRDTSLDVLLGEFKSGRAHMAIVRQMPGESVFTGVCVCVFIMEKGRKMQK